MYIYMYVYIYIYVYMYIHICIVPLPPTGPNRSEGPNFSLPPCPKELYY